VIRKTGNFDIIFCGQKAIDGETAQVGPGIAENLHIPQITCVSNAEVEGMIVKAWRETEFGQEVIQVKLPVLMTAMKGPNEPRVPTFARIAEAMEKRIPIWSADEVGGEKNRFGLVGSPTRVVKTWVPEQRKRGQMLEGDPDAVAQMLSGILKDII
jgi:electron transfer flavoprotein beta subunit